MNFTLSYSMYNLNRYKIANCKGIFVFLVLQRGVVIKKRRNVRLPRGYLMVTIATHHKMITIVDQRREIPEIVTRWGQSYKLNANLPFLLIALISHVEELLASLMGIGARRMDS